MPFATNRTTAIATGVLALCLNQAYSATIRFSNINNTSNGAWVVTNAQGELLTNGAATIRLGTSSSSYNAMVNAWGDLKRAPATERSTRLTNLYDAFQPFGEPVVIGEGSAGIEGIWEVSLSQDTRPSQSVLGGQPVMLWLVTGDDPRSPNAEHLILQMRPDQTFPTDPELGAPASGNVELRPDNAQTFLHGGVGKVEHDMGFGAGPLPVFNTEPIPEPSTLALIGWTTAAWLSRREKGGRGKGTF